MVAKKAGVTLVVAILFSFHAFPSNYISTASIFELGVSARVLGLGGAFIAMADDQAAAFHNPAGLCQLSKPGFSSHFTRPSDAFSYGALGMAERGWGTYLMVLDSDTLEKRDLYGNPIGTFRYTSLGMVFGFGQELGSGLSLGLQVKAYGLAFPTQGFGFSLSPSLLFREGARTYGIMWRNLVSMPIQYVDGHTEPWITDIAAGIAWMMGKETCLVDFTENLIVRGDISCVRMGCESRRFYPLVLRAGTNREGVTFGFSISWQGIRLDFALLLHQLLPETYVASFSYWWE